MNKRYVIAGALWASVLASVRLAPAQSYAIDWLTVDGGGHMFSTGGGYAVGATVGQPDASSFAQPFSGGTYQIVGGFWVIAQAPTCACPGDFVRDGVLNGDDLQAFVTCLISGGDCGCADLDGNGLIGAADAVMFAAALVGGAVCP